MLSGQQIISRVLNIQLESVSVIELGNIAFLRKRFYDKITRLFFIAESMASKRSGCPQASTSKADDDSGRLNTNFMERN